MNVDISNIESVYSGKSYACMCGCSGKYTYNSKYRKLASKRCGYPIGEDQISDRIVKLIANKVLKNPKHIREDNYACLDNGKRRWVVYFLE